MQGKMKAIVKTEPDYGAVIKEVEIPDIGTNQVLVKVIRTSICGTDFHIYSWDKWARENIKPPQIMGHELAGEVVEIGDSVSRINKSDYVSAETHIRCGHCYQCRTGKPHICREMKILGVHTDGVFAEYAVIDAHNVWINEDDIPHEYASIQEPLGNAIDTIRPGDVAGKNILITGAGPIGLLSVGVARAFGAATILVSEPNQYRRDIAREMGADEVINPLNVNLNYAVNKITGGIGVDFVAEMSGNITALKNGLKSITRGGSIALLGLPDGEVGLDLSSDVIFKGINIYGITGREMYRTWYTASRLIKERKINLEPVITHRFAFDDYKKGMELMKTGNCGKIILEL